MDGINFLSPANFAEENLRIIAEDKVFVTEKYKFQIEELQRSNCDLLSPKAFTIAIIAIGIILGISGSVVIGACIVVVSIIPGSIWMEFVEKNRSVQAAFDKEKEKLEEIYQQMINTIHSRYFLSKFILKVVEKNPAMKQKSISFLRTELNNAITQFLVKWEKEKSDMEAAVKQSMGDQEKEEENQLFIKFSNFYGKSKIDLTADLNKLAKNAESIAHSKLKIDHFESKWKELKQVCEDYHLLNETLNVT